MTALVRLTSSGLKGLPCASWRSVQSGLGVATWRAQDQQRGLVGDLLGVEERCLQTIAIVGHLTEPDDVPSVRLEAHADVVAVRQ